MLHSLLFVRIGVFKIKKKKRQRKSKTSKSHFVKKKSDDHKDIYAMISIAAFILVISFAINTVHTTEAALNGIKSPSGMASLDVNETDMINESMEPMLVKNGSTWQLRKLRFK